MMHSPQTLVPLDVHPTPRAAGGTGTSVKRSMLRNDAGMSMVEIIVMVFILSLIGVGLTLMFINSTTSQQHTAARDKATGQAAVLTEVFADSLRNAVAVKISADGSRLDTTMIVSDGATQWFECRSWAVEPGGDLVYSSGKTPRSDSTMPWKTLVKDVSGALPPSNHAFAQAGKQIEIGLAIAPPTKLSAADAVVIRQSVTAQARHDEKKGAVTPCLGG